MRPARWVPDRDAGGAQLGFAILLDDCASWLWALSFNVCPRCLRQCVEHFACRSMWSASPWSVFANVCVAAFEFVFHVVGFALVGICKCLRGGIFHGKFALHVVPSATSTVSGLIAVAAHHCAVPNQSIPESPRGGVKVGAVQGEPAPCPPLSSQAALVVSVLAFRVGVCFQLWATSILLHQSRASAGKTACVQLSKGDKRRTRDKAEAVMSTLCWGSW